MLLLGIINACLGLSACSGSHQKPTPDEVRERTARATAEFKQNAKAVAEGVREGWSKDGVVNINKADKKELTTLSGIGSDTADRIIAGRPYGNTRELVSRHVLSQRQYDRIEPHVMAGK